MGIYIRQTGRLNKIRDFGPDKPWYDSTLSVAGNFDVQNIPQQYTSMRIEMLLRGDVSATSDVAFLYLNNDTTDTNYLYGQIAGGSAAVSNASGDEPRVGGGTGATSPANYFAIVEIFIAEYAGSKSKIMFTTSNQRRDATTILTTIATVSWENTAAITHITSQPNGYSTDKWDAGSRMRVWLER